MYGTATRLKGFMCAITFHVYTEKVHIRTVTFHVYTFTETVYTQTVTFRIQKTFIVETVPCVYLVPATICWHFLGGWGRGEYGRTDKTVALDSHALKSLMDLEETISSKQIEQNDLLRTNHMFVCLCIGKDINEQRKYTNWWLPSLIQGGVAIIWGGWW